MEFRLKYEGPLKSKGDKQEKHRLREYFHPQLKELFTQPPFQKIADYFQSLHSELMTSKVGEFTFFHYVSSQLNLFAELDITLMRPDKLGAIISSGDIDNRLKTLLDALRAPQNENEIPKGAKPTENQNPFYCVLEDDSLITSVKVTCDRLLKFENPKDVFLLIHVNTKQIKTGQWHDSKIA
jgi:hypothetical protein